MPLTEPAPPTQQDAPIIYEYGTENFQETKFGQDYEDKYLDGENIKVLYFYSNYSKIVHI
jgi:hypothetical protein